MSVSDRAERLHDALATLEFAAIDYAAAACSVAPNRRWDLRSARRVLVTAAVAYTNSIRRAREDRMVGAI
jgi:hypothetical protein